MSDIAIQVQNVSKCYRLGEVERYRTLRDTLTRAGRRLLGRGTSSMPVHGRAIKDHEFWALKDVCFEVKHGDVVGIIGRNGAGKSTLLKILSRITEPTAGRAELNGRVGSLLEVGTGFHPELTGRENIYLNGAILGMTRGEIKSKFDEIVAFSEIEKFLDTPVKRYSSGMYVRLAFAVAAHLEPEILIVDEVLAVGDAAFQSKCLGKMSNVAREGRTVLFVSHNMAAVEALCNRGILIDAGTIAASGAVEDVVARYVSGPSRNLFGQADLRNHTGRDRASSSVMTRVSLESSRGEDASVIAMGSSLIVNVEFESSRAFAPILGVSIKTLLGAPVFTVNNRFIPGYRFESKTAGTIACTIDELPLMPGTYSIDLYLGDETHDIDIVHDAVRFDIVAADVYGTGKLPAASAGPIFWRAAWSLESAATIERVAQQA